MPAKEFDAFTRLDASDVNTFLVNNGELREVVYFTSSGTFTKATYPWLNAIKIKCQGAGGGSGGSGATGAGQVNSGGSGGGGVYAESFITDIDGLASSITVTIGAGGAAGAAGNNAGSNGGSSSFGTVVSANGGNGGVAGVPAAPPTFNLATVNSTTGTGDLVIAGQGTEQALYITTGGITSPRGGNSVLGIGAHGRTGGQGGGPGLLYGGGASGGSTNPSSGAVAGAAGGNGIVIVELYA
jgi:hypothetical protein